MASQGVVNLKQLMRVNHSTNGLTGNHTMAVYSRAKDAVEEERDS